MGEWSANNQDRAKAVWDKLLGIFGDGLLRKFGDTPPAEWVEAIGALNDFQLRRGVQRLIYSWKGGAAPSLPDFVRFCRVIGDDAPDEGPQQRVALPAPEKQQFDGWDVSGNMRFWKYVTHRLTARPRAWGSGSAQERATRIAVSYKNAWAQDMRESSQMDAATGEIIQLPEDEQQHQFEDCMKRAESDIAAHQARAAA